MRNGKWIALVAGMLAVAAGVLIMTWGGGKKSSPAPQVAAAKVVKIVSSMPRTGSANAQTTTIVNGIRMAIDEFGSKVGNFKIVYEDWDDASAKKGDWDPEVVSANANKAAGDPNILFYIGTYNSGASKIAMPILNRANLVMISPANTYPGLTKPGKGEPNEPYDYRPTGKVNFFRVVPADDLQGGLAAQWMKEMCVEAAKAAETAKAVEAAKAAKVAQKVKSKGVEGAQAKKTCSVYILDDRGLYGKGIANVLKATAGENNLKVLGSDGIDPKAQEYRSLMTKIRALNPDWVYFGGSTQTNGGQIAKDMVAVGLRAKLMVPDGCYEEAFIKAAGAKNIEGRVFFTFGGMPPDKLTGKGAEFVSRYRQKYDGKMPEGYAIYGYVAAKVALNALARAGKKDREEIRQAVAATGQIDGALGMWHFDDNGDTTLKTMSGSTVKDGKFKFVKLLGVPPALDPLDAVVP